MHTSTSTTTAAPRHALRGRFNAWILAATDGHTRRGIGPARSRVFGALGGEVVDIGAGNGAVLPYLSPAVRRLHAVEPNVHFHDRLRRAAAEHPTDVVLHATRGEELDFSTASVDGVTTSWVLCTVDDPAAVLAEIRRVLRPGGRFAFVEHVAAPPGTAVRAVQDAVQTPWRWLFEGCDTTRDTEEAVRAAGFRSVAVERVHFATPFVPIRTQIAGVAIA